MLYILHNEFKQAPWQVMYETEFERCLSEVKYPYTIIDSYRMVHDLKKDDFLWVMFWKDLLYQTVRETKASVISESNGTASVPYHWQVKYEEEKELMENIIDISLVFNKRQIEQQQALYPDPYYIEVGFPTVVPKRPRVPFSLRTDTILIAGRISPDKQPFLATYLLQDAVREGYKVIFSTNDDEKNRYWYNYLDLKKFERLGFEFQFNTREKYLRLCEESKYYFSCSLGDISQIACAEAVMLGCYPIIPKFKTGLPTYDAYLSVGYEPFSKSEVMEIILNHPLYNFDRTYFDPMTCTNKLLAGLERYARQRTS